MAENLLTFSPLLLISVHQLNCFEIIHSFLCSHCCHKIYVWMNIKHLIVFHLSTLNTIKRNIKSAIFYFWWHFLWYITILFNIHTEFFYLWHFTKKNRQKSFPIELFYWALFLLCEGKVLIYWHYVWSHRNLSVCIPLYLISSLQLKLFKYWLGKYKCQFSAFKIQFV